MKKLMIAACAVAIAASAQAASIIWGGDIGLPPDGDDSVMTGSVAYLIKGSTAASVAITSIIVDGTDWKKWTTNIEGTTIVASHTLTALEAESNYRFDAFQPIKGDTDKGFYAIVVVDGKAGADGLTGAYAYLGENTSGSPTGKDVDITVGDNWKSGEAPFIGMNGFDAVEFTAAPEPTSGLLMLIGMGALALRRRRA